MKAIAGRLFLTFLSTRDLFIFISLFSWSDSTLAAIAADSHEKLLSRHERLPHVRHYWGILSHW